MPQRLARLGLTTSILFTILVRLPAQTAPGYARPELLIEPADLAKPETRAGIVILDAREQKKFDELHIVGARWVDHTAWSTAFGDGNDAVGWSRRIAQLGIAADSRVVIYDDNSSKEAGRIWWILRYWGIERATLLNGGWKAWNAARLEVTKTPLPPIQPAELSLKPRAERLATKSQVLDSLKKGSLQIVDSRSEGEFCGTAATTTAKRAGAIPGAIHLEWSDLLEKDSQRFKPAPELRRLFKDAGIDLTKPTMTHCQSGGRASVMVFGMELLGAKDVSNYYRSWAEWGNAEETPIVPGKPRAK